MADNDDRCAALMFHTAWEENPWIEFNLGKPTPIHHIEAHNRVDCCQERAVPLVAEVSNDRVQWRQVGRRDSAFSVWKLTFPPASARFVRLRVPRPTIFHLKGVVIR